ncbi:LPXTG cell wall anchor domain-containing protein [Trueperella bialowiezensis]|uniref:Gram-positive cocci surface proteins LPxTG domain-containing protein n=1 Tax=Trueperella bialowiezensis TaxID=312285 RepID=A0A3S4VRV8_9ACTO|nr:LPXTG cell wall anchor domain-containing protein [Trueperella bialowiezensis]VEI12358.1 Uncharacterised protein [Trueperella bialowiezensis]
MHTINVRRPALFIVLLIAVFTLFIPQAVADESRWSNVESQRHSEFGGIRNGSESIALCTGDRQLNFVYQRGLESASFESYSTTQAGQAYTRQPTEHGWDANVPAENTGVLAAVLDLWGDERASGIAPEAFSIAIYELTSDARGAQMGGQSPWKQQARDLLDLARDLAGPHTADEISLHGSELSGFVVRGQAGKPLVGIPFTAQLTGGVFVDSATDTLNGTTGNDPQRFAIEAPAFGQVSVKITYSNIPGHSFRTGHHSVAQDMHLVGEPGSITQDDVLRDQPSPVGISMSTEAAVLTTKDARQIQDVISINADTWPSNGEEPAVYDVVANLYGPFDDQQPEQPTVPEGLEPIETATLRVTEPGTYTVPFESELSHGWYTVVASGKFDTTGAFTGLPDEVIQMPFFEPAETVHVEIPEPEQPPTPSSPPTPQPAPTEPEKPVQRRLPDTGSATLGFAVIGGGMVSLGGAFVTATRRRV